MMTPYTKPLLVWWRGLFRNEPSPLDFYFTEESKRWEQVVAKAFWIQILELTTRFGR